MLLFFYCVYFIRKWNLQSSNKPDRNLTVNHEETVVNNSAIKFYYNDNDYFKMIKADIDSVTSTISLISLITNSIFIVLVCCYLLQSPKVV